MKEIELTQGYVTLVDDEDYNQVLAVGPWHAQVYWRKNGNKKVYAQRNIRKPNAKRIMQKMHCFIMGIKGIDHKDGNGLNNQRHNLRPATKSQNGRNQGIGITNTSGYKGVSWHKRIGKWQAYITVNKKRICLGYFTDSLDAAHAYDAAALKYHGEFALTNEMLGLYKKKENQ